MKRVISFSLWCQDKPLDGYNYQTHNMYCFGAIRNLELKKQYYEDWTFRYYVNSTVPNDVQEKFRKTLCSQNLEDLKQKANDKQQWIKVFTYSEDIGQSNAN